jgi:hypothetical protein
VQASGTVLLHYKAMLRFFFELGRWLGGLLETAFALVFLEGHRSILALSD